MKNRIWYLILLGLALRLAFLFKFNPVWWDGSVYIGMGKYIFTWGHMGIWEPLRPLVLPLILGAMWKAGIDPVFFGRILEIIFSLAAVYATYLIGKKYRGEEDGLIAAAILCFTPVFFEFSFHHYTEIPSTLFALLAVYYFMDKNMIASGALASLAFLTKFPQGMAIFVLGLCSLTRIKMCVKLCLAFVALTSVYLISNYFMYGSLLKPIIDGNYIIKYAGIWIFAQPWWFYIWEMLRENFLYVFALIGVSMILRKGERLVPLLAIIFLLYFSNAVHKEPRFMIMFLPYFALLAAFGIRKIFRQKFVPYIVLVICIALLFINQPTFPNAYEGKDAFFKHLEGKEVRGEALVSHPYISMHSSNLTAPMYYMVFGSELAKQWTSYIDSNYSKIQYVFIDTCEGGMLCPPWDDRCEVERERLISKAEEKFVKEFYEEREKCRYYIFKNNQL
ncbi:MAG: glycosyltransferase family 39 protein [Candidatus Woesearchaeota archaeon]